MLRCRAFVHYFARSHTQTQHVTSQLVIRFRQEDGFVVFPSVGASSLEDSISMLQARGRQEQEGESFEDFLSIENCKGQNELFEYLNMAWQDLPTFMHILAEAGNEDYGQAAMQRNVWIQPSGKWTLAHFDHYDNGAVAQ